MDRLEEEQKIVEKKDRKEIEKKAKNYDPLKREPKYAHAEDSPVWELVMLAKHCHPTVCIWAEKLLKGETLDYPGDPLLDFGLSNFLDRIAYKNPKSEEKIAGYRSRMAAYEKPVNQYAFQEGDEPETKREEEQFMYKYMQMKEVKKPKEEKVSKKEVEGFESDEDPELEAFAQKEIEE